MAYGVVFINKRLTYITNDTLTSRHECILDTSAFNLNLPRRLANCKADIGLCNKNSPIVLSRFRGLFCTKRYQIGLETISANVNYALKLVLQV
jgi:hypothetical protein